MRTFEQDAENLKLRILRLAAEEDIDSAVMIAALADVLGLTAAVLDKRAQPVDFDTRMDEIITRAKQQYVRAKIIDAQGARPQSVVVNLRQ